MNRGSFFWTDVFLYVGRGESFKGGDLGGVTCCYMGCIRGGGVATTTLGIFLIGVCG